MNENQPREVVLFAQSKFFIENVAILTTLEFSANITEITCSRVA